MKRTVSTPPSSRLFLDNYCKTPPRPHQCFIYLDLFSISYNEVWYIVCTVQCAHVLRHVLLYFKQNELGFLKCYYSAFFFYLGQNNALNFIWEKKRFRNYIYKQKQFLRRMTRPLYNCKLNFEKKFRQEIFNSYCINVILG